MSNRHDRRYVGVLLALGCALLGTGCHHYVCTCHYGADGTAVTTPSSEAAYAQPAARAELVRDVDVFAIAPEDGSVKHGPLYYGDPFAQAGGADEHYGITLTDYREILCRQGRFFANLLFSPANMIAYPPCTTMVSDGMLGRRCPGELRDPVRAGE